MKVFDLHADIACALKPVYDSGERNILNTRWNDSFRQGEMTWTAAASFFHDEDWDEMVRTVNIVKEEVERSGHKKILTADDLNEDQDEVAYLMTIEGMHGIESEVEDKIQWLYDQGNRIGSLEWNDENALATGNSGDPARGLTDLGKQAVHKMNALHFIIDISHANEHTFWDILDESILPIIATHSNAKRLCGVDRNLTDQQIKALANKGGIIGMNACPGFISDNKEEQDAWHLAKHARYIADLVGAEHVACGFDFGDYYSDSQQHDLHNPSQTQNFIEGLRKEGFNEEEIEMIAYKNVFNFLRKYM